MSKFQKIQIPTGVKIIVFIIALATLYSISKSTLLTNEFFKYVMIGYARSIAAVLKLFFSTIQFDSITGNIIYEQLVIRTISGLAVKFYAIIFAVLFFFPRNIAKTILVFFIASAVFYVLALLRFVNDIVASATLSGFFFSTIVGLRYLTVYFVVKYKIDQHASLSKYFNQIDVKVQSAFHFSFHKLLILIALVPAITGFFDWFLIAKWNYFVTVLSNIILWLSNAILWLFGFGEAYIYDKFILLDKYWVYLGTNCLGVGLMVVFSSLIIAIRSPLINKVIYVIVGLIFLLLLNAVRIVGILLYIALNKIPQHLIEDYHNQSNNLFYLIVFVIILFYITKFQYLKLRFNRKIKK